MTITVEITARVQAELARQADISGRNLERCAAALLEEALYPSLAVAPPLPTDRRTFGKSLIDTFDQAQRLGLFEGDSLDFSREPSPGRPVDLS